MLREHKRRLISLVLSVAMLFSLMGTAFATELSEESNSDPISIIISDTDQIVTSEDLSSTEVPTDIAIILGEDQIESNDENPAPDADQPVDSGEATETPAETGKPLEEEDKTPEEVSQPEEIDPSNVPIETVGYDVEVIQGNTLGGVPIITPEYTQSSPAMAAPSQDGLAAGLMILDDFSVPVQSYGAYSAPRAFTGVPTTSQEAYQRLIALQAQYPEGKTWTNETPYGSAGPLGDGYRPNQPVRLGNAYITSGVGCAAYAFILSDELFGNQPQVVRTNFKYEDVHVGDHLRLYGNTHSAIVLQVTPAGCIVTEANYNKSVHWGRVIGRAEVEAASYLITRWPAGLPDDEGIGDTTVKQGTVENISWKLSGDGVLTFEGTGPMPDYATSSDAPWSGLNYSTVVIADGITCIGINAFSDSAMLPVSNLTEVRIPGSVTAIKANAFRNCAKLVSAHIPSGVREIGDNAFRNCSSLTQIDLPGTITHLGAGAFAECYGATTIIFANSAASANLSIGEGLFARSWNMHTVILPSNLPRISAGMFQSCSSLFVLNIPKSVKTIDGLCFASTGIASGRGEIRFEGSRADWLKATNNASLADLGITGADNLDEAVASGMITFNVPYVNPFATDDSDLVAGNACEEFGHDWSNADGICKVCGEECKHEFKGTVICDICKYEHHHEWSTTFSKDAVEHWYTCTVADCPLGHDENAARNDITHHVYNQTGHKCICGVTEPAELHEHVWSDWKTDHDFHWKECTDPYCPYKGTDEAITDREYHTYPAANEGDTHVICTACGYTKPTDYVPHQHIWEEDYSTSATHHWKDCTKPVNPDCTATNEYAEHTFDDQTGRCTVCNYEKPAESHQHIWPDEWMTDAATGGNHHWKHCTTCNEVDHYAEHEYGENGLCVCGAEKPEDPEPPVDPDPPIINPDTCEHVDINGDGKCDRCGKIMPPVTCEHVDANNDGICDECGETLTTNPPVESCEHVDADENGVCDKCGQTMPGYQPPTPPTPTEHTHSWQTAWSYNNAYHWHNCSNDCPITEVSQKSGYAAHNYGSWFVDVYATAYRDGSQHRDCLTCAYRETAVIPATGYYPSGGNPGTSGNNHSNSNNSNNNSGNNSTNTTPTKPVTTTTVDQNTGIKTETTTYPDGAKQVVVTYPNNTVVTTNTSTSGQQDIKVELPTTVINTAKQQGEYVSLPINAISVAPNLSIATPVTISTPQSTATLVAIPAVVTTTATNSAGTVAVITKPDGSTEIVKASALVDGKVVMAVSGETTVKLISNSKSFVDVPSNSWYVGAVAFASARELFAGTGNDTFAPDAPMTRAMLMTVLARFDGVNTNGGSVWYSKGMEWAIARGISDGSNPDANISREQLVTMLWRYIGEPQATLSLNAYSDAAQINNYARVAMSWAVQNGLVSGVSNDSLAPQGQATRAQVATILQRFIINILLDPAK